MLNWEGENLCSDGGVLQIRAGSSKLGRGQEEMLDCTDLWCKDEKLGRYQGNIAGGWIDLGQAETVKGKFFKEIVWITRQKVRHAPKPLCEAEPFPFYLIWKSNVVSCCWRWPLLHCSSVFCWQSYLLFCARASALDHTFWKISSSVDGQGD